MVLLGRRRAWAESVRRGRVTGPRRLTGISRLRRRCVQQETWRHGLKALGEAVSLICEVLLM